MDCFRETITLKSLFTVTPRTITITITILVSTPKHDNRFSDALNAKSL